MVQRKRIVGDREPKKAELHRCGDCSHAVPVMEPKNLLSIDGRPTLGTCPFWKESRCVLLSWRVCCEHFEQKDIEL